MLILEIKVSLIEVFFSCAHIERICYEKKGAKKLEGITIEQILECFAMQGPFAVLFVWMLITIKKEVKNARISYLAL